LNFCLSAGFGTKERLRVVIAGLTRNPCFARSCTAIGCDGSRLKAGMTALSRLLCAGRPLRRRLLRGGLVRVDVLLDAPGRIHARRVDLEPALGLGALNEGGAAHVGDVVHRLFRSQPVRDLDDRPLGVAVQEDVALRVDQDCPAHLVGPVVVMRDAAQASFDAAQHDRHILEGFAAALAVDDGRAVRPLATRIARRVRIVRADLAVGGVAVDHRIHVAGGDAEEQVGPAQRLERLGALPVGLSDDAHAKALGLQHAADHRHAEARMIDVGVARHDDDVAAVPAQPIHLGAAHRQERRRAQASRPVLAVAGNRLGGASEQRDVGGSVHRGRDGKAHSRALRTTHDFTF
jgi:hypothetical protein